MITNNISRITVVGGASCKSQRVPGADNTYIPQVYNKGTSTQPTNLYITAETMRQMRNNIADTQTAIMISRLRTSSTNINILMSMNQTVTSAYDHLMYIL